MAFATGEVVPTPCEKKSFAAVIMAGDEEILREPVDSVREGEDLIAYVLRRIAELVREDGYR